MLYLKGKTYSNWAIFNLLPNGKMRVTALLSKQQSIDCEMPGQNARNYFKLLQLRGWIQINPTNNKYSVPTVQELRAEIGNR